LGRDGPPASVAPLEPPHATRVAEVVAVELYEPVAVAEVGHRVVSGDLVGVILLEGLLDLLEGLILREAGCLSSGQYQVRDDPPTAVVIRLVLPPESARPAEERDVSLALGDAVKDGGGVGERLAVPEAVCLGRLDVLGDIGRQGGHRCSGLFPEVPAARDVRALWEDDVASI